METKTEIVLRWVPACRYFVIESKDGELAMQEIPEEREKIFSLLSCLGVLMKFPNRSKEKPQAYEVIIRHKGDAFKE